MKSVCLGHMPPAWFQRYISASSSNHRVKVFGKDIHYRRWSTQDNPGLLFVHGYGAHSHWWDFIAPAFIENFDVVAMDMSGAGDSAHRDLYQARIFATEIIGVCKDAGLRSPVIIGHSFGGAMTRVAAWANGGELAGAVLVDTMLSREGRQRTPVAYTKSGPRTRIRYYDSLAEGAKRFRLRPAQPCANRYILNYIARHSLARGKKGYSFKLDQALFSKMRGDTGDELPDALTMITESQCPIGIIYGQNSRILTAESATILKDLVGEDLIQCVPDSHHHVFLDQPLAFIDTLRNLLPKLQTSLAENQNGPS